MYRELDRNAPMFLQIFDRLKKDIIRGKYPPNAQIPTVRQLACDMSVNPNTVQKALQILEDEGLIITRATLGKFVTSDTECIERVKQQLQKEPDGQCKQPDQQKRKQYENQKCDKIFHRNLRIKGTVRDILTTDSLETGNAL